MGLFDQLGGGLSGLAGGGADVQGGLGAMLEQHGGVGGLVAAFQKGGLGALAQSWIGSGQNLPVSPDQITQVLGSGPVADFAAKLGIDPQQAAGHLSQLLPQLIDHLTPTGQVQPGAAGGLDGLLDRFKGG